MLAFFSTKISKEFPVSEDRFFLGRNLHEMRFFENFEMEVVDSLEANFSIKKYLAAFFQNIWSRSCDCELQRQRCKNLQRQASAF
jgi:hypothetical protein